MSPSVPASAVSEALRRHIDPKSPAPMRIMAAKGLVPMGPKDMVTVLVCLCSDEDPKIKEAALDSLAKLPEKLVLGALKEELHEAVLDQLARVFKEKEPCVEALLLNQATADETYAFLSGEPLGERMLNIIAENQVRVLRHPPIAEALVKNPRVPRSSVDRLMDFAVRTGLEFASNPAFEEAKQRILHKPVDPQEEARLEQVIVASLPPELLEELDEAALRDLTPEQVAEQEKHQLTLLQKLATMTPGQKIVLASKGNKAARTQLVRDSNKLVATAAIRNPGVTESEAAMVASSRSVSDDVIRFIANHREWTKNYAIRLQLVQNPKTPIAVSMKFLQVLRPNDLKSVAASKNVSSAIAAAAKKLSKLRAPS